jgi:hypothetical protein
MVIDWLNRKRERDARRAQFADRIPPWMILGPLVYVGALAALVVLLVSLCRGLVVKVRERRPAADPADWDGDMPVSDVVLEGRVQR